MLKFLKNKSNVSRFFITCFLGVIWTNAAMAIASSNEEIGQMYVECSVYYTYGDNLTAQQGLGTPAQHESMHKAFVISYQLAKTVFNDDTIKAKGELALKEMMAIERQESFSRLILMYGDKCKALLENSK